MTNTIFYSRNKITFEKSKPKSKPLKVEALNYCFYFHFSQNSLGDNTITHLAPF
ncbi:hypothetical protein KSS87_000736 [Heliosperma pusillum]|nr:hypothetical protein KSS87_000736 [Heliosperma pusillum]